MAAVEDEVIFECPLLKLRGTRKKTIKLGGSNSWQPKYFMLKKQGNIPYIEYYNKKPRNRNAIPRGKVPLRPSFRVEKSVNAKNRAYVFEVVTPARRLCLSADEQKVMDMFVFYLQIQVKLSTDVIDDFFIVNPENSEAHRRIGSRGAWCIFHIAPWGVTLALQNSRAVLAQWPLKCIRCYESNSNNQFILEAGRIAPMGDGVYVFNTRPNEDNAIYDLLDKYVLAATAALQGRHPNNQEQFHDLQLERDRLNALTTISTVTPQNTELSQITLQNYNYSVQDLTQGQNSGNSDTDSLGYLHPRALSHNVQQNTELSRGLQLTNEMFGVGHSPDPNRNILSQRPPIAAPARLKLKSTSMEKALEASADSQNGVDAVDGYWDMRQSTESLDVPLNRTISVPPMSPGTTEWFPPPTFVEATRVSAGSYTGLKVASVVGSPEVRNSPLHLGPVLPDEDQSFFNPRASEPDPNTLPKKRAKPPVAPRGRNNVGESPSTTPRPRYRMMRMKSRSAEDVNEFHQEIYVNAEVDSAREKDKSNNGKRTPEPFIGLDPFGNKRHSEDRPSGRRFLKNERSQNGALNDTQSLQSKQAQLRRSVSNPNFFDLESKDILKKREKSYKPETLGKSPNRSLASLLPGALKRHLSRENNASNNNDATDSLLDGSISRGRSNSFRLRSSSVTKSSSDIPSASSFVRGYRRSSFGSKDSVSASTKGITVSEKSRSFRKYKSVDANLNRQHSELSTGTGGSVSSAGTDSTVGSPNMKTTSSTDQAVSPQTDPRATCTGAKSASSSARSSPSVSRLNSTASPPTPSRSPATPSRSPAIPSRLPLSPSRSTDGSSYSPSVYQNGHSPAGLYYDTQSLPVRKKKPSIMAGRRLPSLPDEKKCETPC